MPAPSLPSLNSLVREGLEKAGESSPTAALVTRAESIWMEELKADLYTRIHGKKLKSLMSVFLQPVTNGRQEYDNPSDFALDISLTFKTGNTYGVAQTATSQDITLAANEAATDLIGREIIIYSGTGFGQSRFIHSYNATTKVAGISPTWTTTPVTGDLYLIVGYSKPVLMGAVWDHDRRVVTGRSEPEMYHPVGNSSTGKYLLNPVPYRTDSQPMVLQHRYYANIMKLDLSGALLATLYQSWRMLWTMGIKWKHFESENEDRETNGYKQYDREAKRIISMEQYGSQMNDQQIHITDYT